MLKLRDLKPGESRYSGHLTTIECGAEGIILIVNVDAGTVRARAPRSTPRLHHISRRMQGQIECGPRKTPASVLITLRLDAGTTKAGQQSPWNSCLTSTSRTTNAG